MLSQISTVELNSEKKNVPVKIENIEYTKIVGTMNDEKKEITINNGYLDIGLNDTMEDLIVNFIGAVIFSIIGLLYIKGRDEYKFAENFIQILKNKNS